MALDEHPGNIDFKAVVENLKEFCCPFYCSACVVQNFILS